MELGAGYEEKTLNDLTFFIYSKPKIMELKNSKEIGNNWINK
jgi:hypothetical protein